MPPKKSASLPFQRICFLSLSLCAVGQGDWAFCAADRLQQSGVLRHGWLIYDLCTATYPEQAEMFSISPLVNTSLSVTVVHQGAQELFCGRASVLTRRVLS